MLKFILSLAALVSVTAFAEAKKSELVECLHVTIIKVETNEAGEQKVAVVHPHVLKCQPQKPAEPEAVPTKVPRLFPRQP
ncbi:MAG: hypothetical protein FJW84_01430 [Actinobacteria bacterium]|nr:hypothetical protein [Actinomycetota bacterium]